MSTNKNNRVSIICYCNPFLVYHQHKHNARHLATNSFSSHLSHTALLYTSFPSYWKGLTTRGTRITRFALYSHSLNAFTRPWSRASPPTRLKPQHPHRYGIEGFCGPASSHSLCSQPQWCLCPCGCCCMPYSISRLSRNKMLSNINSRMWVKQQV